MSKLQVGDFKNSYETLERHLRKIEGFADILQENEEVRVGEPTSCVKIMKLLLLSTVREVANHIVSRGCSSASTDTKIVLVAFDFLR